MFMIGMIVSAIITLAAIVFCNVFNVNDRITLILIGVYCGAISYAASELLGKII